MPTGLLLSRTDPAGCRTIGKRSPPQGKFTKPSGTTSTLNKQNLWQPALFSRIQGYRIRRAYSTQGHMYASFADWRSPAGHRGHQRQFPHDLKLKDTVPELVDNKNGMTHYSVSVLSLLPTWPPFSTKMVKFLMHAMARCAWPGVFETGLIFPLAWNWSYIRLIWGLKTPLNLDVLIKYGLTFIFVKY